MSEQDTYEYYRIAKDIVTRPHSIEDLAEGQIYATMAVFDVVAHLATEVRGLKQQLITMNAQQRRQS